MGDCLFCKIANGEIPSQKVFENDQVLAFKDIDPQAPVHILIIPKKHYDNVIEADNETMSALFDAARALAKELNVDEDGFRIVINTGKNGGQSVGHIHLHLLGARELGWPPG